MRYLVYLGNDGRFGNRFVKTAEILAYAIEMGYDYCIGSNCAEIKLDAVIYVSDRAKKNWNLGLGCLKVFRKLSSRLTVLQKCERKIEWHLRRLHWLFPKGQLEGATLMEPVPGVESRVCRTRIAHVEVDFIFGYELGLRKYLTRHSKKVQKLTCANIYLQKMCRAAFLFRGTDYREYRKGTFFLTPQDVFVLADEYVQSVLGADYKNIASTDDINFKQSKCFKEITWSNGSAGESGTLDDTIRDLASSEIIVSVPSTLAASISFLGDIPAAVVNKHGIMGVGKWWEEPLKGMDSVLG